MFRGKTGIYFYYQNTAESDRDDAITYVVLLLISRPTRTAYLYNRCLAWYNVVLTSWVHSSVKYSQQSQLRSRATVE